MKQTWVAIAIILAAAAAGAVATLILSRGEPTPAAATGPRVSVTVAVQAGETDALLYLAKSKGYFEERNLDVKLRPSASSCQAIQTIVAGEADLATASDFVVAQGVIQHEDLTILGTIARVNINALLARRDRDIRSATDLKGRRIGVTRDGIGEFLLTHYLILKDLRPTDIELVDLKPQEIVNAFSMGSIDAAFVSEPQVYGIQRAMDAEITNLSDFGSHHHFVLLVGMDRWVYDNPNAAQRFLDALIDAENYIRENKSGAQSILAARLECTHDYLQKVWDKHEFGVTLPQALLVSLEDEARWQLRALAREQRTIPNYFHAIYRDALAATRPEAITIIQ